MKSPHVRSALRLLACLLLALAPLSSFAGEVAKPGQFIHVGLVWLKKPGEKADRQKIVEAVHAFAREIPEVLSVSVGQPQRSESKFVDSSFDVCFTMVFADRAALERYSKNPVHEKAAKELLFPLSEKFVFYDFITE